MKILEERYPIGSLKNQRKKGRYIDGTLWENINILSKTIKKDMTFLGIITSSTLEVGTGKSVLAQQISEAYLEGVRQHHDIDNRLSMQNIVFNPEEIIERSFQVPKYSVVICDEWEDANYWSKLGVSLRKFFRKCRQLNLFMLIIIPNFFELPKTYAISRSVFVIDVRFSGEFDRGYFSFYNFQKKKLLYLKGKRQHDYDVCKPNFIGRFADGYVVDEEEYRLEKMKDLEKQEKEEVPKPTEKIIKMKIFYKLYCFFEKRITIKELSEAFGVTSRTGDNWLKKGRENEISEFEFSRGINSNLMEEEDYD